jgi:hypothetical protein
VADHPLRPANHHRLGRPLPYQLANSTQAHPLATARGHLSPSKGTYAVLTPISRRYSSLKGRFPRVTHPSAAELLPLDLHVLGAPPTFILSQDQTLHHKIMIFKVSLSQNSQVFSLNSIKIDALRINFWLSMLALSKHILDMYVKELKIFLIIMNLIITVLSSLSTLFSKFFLNYRHKFIIRTISHFISRFAIPSLSMIL